MTIFADGLFADGLFADGLWAGQAAAGPTADPTAIVRKISTVNQAQIESATESLHEVALVKLDFDEPVYAHTGYGSITFDGNEYIGVGYLGAIADTREAESLGPAPLQLQMSGVDAGSLADALDAGRFGDAVTIYIGYRQDDGLLYDQPWLLWSGNYEFAAVSVGDDNVISITAQHDLAILADADGARYTDEDQQRRYAADTGFEYVPSMATTTLLWPGNQVVSSGGGGGGTNGPPVDRR